jgi:hypothetical protein
MPGRDQSLVQMRAIEWAGQLAGFFPWLRPEKAHVLRFAEEVAQGLHDRKRKKGGKSASSAWD